MEIPVIETAVIRPFFSPHCMADGLSALAVGVNAKQQPANWAHEEADAECRGGQEQRRTLAVGRKE
jgi:hypothetical protein